MWDSELDEKGKMTLLKLVGLGFVLVIGGAVLFNYVRNSEYPELSSEQAITEQWIRTVDVDRGLCFVELENGMKFRVWAENHNYEEYYSLATIPTGAALLSKELNSDTLIVTYSDKQYKYVLGQVITKNR